MTRPMRGGRGRAGRRRAERRPSGPAGDALGAALELLVGLVLGAVFALAPRDGAGQPPAASRVRWRANAAAVRDAQPAPAIGRAVRWTALRPGLEEGALTVTAGGGGLALADSAGRGWTALSIRVVLVRLDPRRFAVRLHAAAYPGGGAGPWSVDAAPAGAALALNAGQFTDRGPWGWVVHGGRELQPPGTGALAAALVVDTSGAARILPADSIPAARARGTIVEAVQSYPALLDGDGRVPDALRADGRGVDRAHRDARLAVGELRDGRLLVALTRFAPLDAGDGAVARAVGRIPVGLTVPETAALMGALGARRAVMLDGGLSAQLLVRDAGGAARRWDGLRRVPLGLVALPRGGGGA